MSIMKVASNKKLCDKFDHSVFFLQGIAMTYTKDKLFHERRKLYLMPLFEGDYYMNSEKKQTAFVSITLCHLKNINILFEK